ncbi:MAG: hypothetical protein V4654_00555 [Bdellovibrionota bacterium]
MKSIFFLVLIFLTSTVFAQEIITPQSQAPIYNNNSLLGGVGFGVETGVLGVQYRRQLSQNFAVHASGLLDFLGIGSGLGAAYLTDFKNEKCLWFLSCTQRFRFAISYLNYGGADRDLSTSGETECENGFCLSSGAEDGATYDVSSSNAFTGTFGFQSQLGSTFFYELQAGYWMPSKKATFKYKSGPQTATDAQALDDMTKAHLALGFVAGISF